MTFDAGGMAQSFLQIQAQIQSDANRAQADFRAGKITQAQLEAEGERLLGIANKQFKVEIELLSLTVSTAIETSPTKFSVARSLLESDRESGKISGEQFELRTKQLDADQAKAKDLLDSAGTLLEQVQSAYEQSGLNDVIAIRKKMSETSATVMKTRNLPELTDEQIRTWQKRN